jgi:hypothetical protein
MKTRRTAVTRVVVALVAAAVVVIATIIAASYLTGSPGTCPIYSAGPGRLDLRVVSDSSGTPISGAQVTATSISASYIAACAQGPSTTVKFTTSSAEWYPLNASDWPSGFSVVVAYSGQSYSFTVGVPVMDMVCASLYIPSGTTNSTNAGFSDTCPPPTAARSTSTGATSTASSGSPTTTITETAGQIPPQGCTLVASNENGSLYVSTSAQVGDVVCMTASLNHSSEVYLAILSAAGKLVFSPGACVATGGTGTATSTLTGDTCTAYWNTASPDVQGGAIKPGTYLLVASDCDGAPPALEANFTLS